MRGSRRRRSIYRREYEKPTDANILRLLMPSILGMLLCMVCLAGMTWAWFTDTSDVATATIQASHYEVETRIATGEGEITGEDGTYTIAPNTDYEVTLTAVGNTTNGGFSAVSVDGDTYYTECMMTGDRIAFTVCSKNGEITINSSWQEFNSGEKTLKYGSYIGRGKVPVEESEEKDQVEQTDQEKSEQPSQPETPKQDEQGHQTEAKAEQPKQPEKTDNTNSNDTKDSDSDGKGNADKPAGPDNSDTSGNSGDSAGSNNSNSGDSSHVDAGSSGTADSGASHTSDDNTAIS